MAKRALDVTGTETPVADFIPYSHHVTESIVVTRNMDYLCVFRFRGRTFETESTHEHKQWVMQLNMVLAGFRAEPLAYWTHIVRHHADITHDGTFRDEWCRDYDAAYQEQWRTDPPLINDLYLTVLLRPDVDPALSKLARFEKRSKEDIQNWQESAIAKIENIQRVIRSSMKEYIPELLTCYVKDEVLFSEVQNFFDLLVNGRSRPAPVSERYMYDALPRSRPRFGRWGEVGMLRDLQWTKQFGAVELFRFPSRIKPKHIDSLLQLPFEFVLAQSFTTLFKDDARKAFKRQGRYMRDANDDGISQIKELETARDQLASDQFVVGEHDAILIIWGESLGQIQDRQAEAISVLSNSDITAKAVDVAIEPAWFSVFPGNWKWRLRPRLITSLNFLSLSPFHNYLSGKPTGNPWGSAVTVLKTEAATALYFNFHASEEYEDAEGKRYAGNTSILGETGTGKTVLLGHLLAQGDRFGMTRVVFDKDRGLDVAIRAMGGRYYTGEIGRPTGWNFLQLPATAANLLFINDQLVLLCDLIDAPLNGAEKERLGNAVKRLLSIPVQMRRLSVLAQFLPDPRVETGRLSLGQRLRQWCMGGKYGWLFDNEVDTLSLQSTLLGFDLTEFLANPIIGSAAMFYLLHRTEALIDGRRFGYFFDECQYPLQYKWFQQLMQDKSRTIRKQNGILTFATQEPDAIARNPVGKTLIQQSATQAFLPNTKATASDYIDDFKLTRSQFEVLQKFGKHSRKILIKQDGAVCTATLDLSRLPHALSIFSGSLDKAEVAEELIGEHGPDPKIWLPLYLERITRL